MDDTTAWAVGQTHVFFSRELMESGMDALTREEKAAVARSKNFKGEDEWGHSPAAVPRGGSVVSVFV